MNVQVKRTQDFGENKNQNHADEEPWLLRRAAHARITDDTDGETSSQTGETDGKTGTQLNEARVEGVLVLLQVVRDEHRHNQAVNADDTSHNDGDDIWIVGDLLAETLWLGAI